jgi:hypothetical protein
MSSDLRELFGSRNCVENRRAVRPLKNPEAKAVKEVSSAAFS